MEQIWLRLAQDVPTDDDLMRLARLNPGYLFERNSIGEVVVSPPAGNQSGLLNAHLLAQVYSWNEMGPNGYAFESSGGFRMVDGSVLSPAVSWISAARHEALSAEPRQRFGPICPELVIEVRSPSDSPAMMLEMLQRLVGFGAAVGVLFDPKDGVTIVDASGTRALGRVATFTIAAGVLAAIELILQFDGLYS